MLLEAEGELLYHTMIGGVQTENGRIVALRICNKAGFSELVGKVFIDATGDADVAFWAGVPCTKGRSKDGLCQPMGMKARYCDVDVTKLRQYIHAHPEQFRRMFRDISVLDDNACISTAIGFDDVWAQAKKDGIVDVPRENVIICETMIPGQVLINTTRLQGFDATDPKDLTNAEIEGRRQSAEIDEFLHRYIPGFENASLMFTGPNVGTRSSRQIVGVYTITEKDVLSQRHFPDEVCYSSFPIDIHSPDGEGTRNVMTSYPYTSYFGIPYRAMVAPQIKNLIVAGRCLSATFEAQSATRTTAIMGAVGHAAGIAAAIALGASDGNTLKVGAAALRKELRQQNAYLETFPDT